jgi:hypothetical protein
VGFETMSRSVADIVAELADTEKEFREASERFFGKQAVLRQELLKTKAEEEASHEAESAALKKAEELEKAAEERSKEKKALEKKRAEEDAAKKAKKAAEEQSQQAKAKAEADAKAKSEADAKAKAKLEADEAEAAKRVEQEKSAPEIEEDEAGDLETCPECDEFNAVGYDYCQACGSAPSRPVAATPEAISPSKEPNKPGRKLASKLTQAFEQETNLAPMSPSVRRATGGSSSPQQVVKSPVCEENPAQEQVFNRLRQRAAEEATTADEASNKAHNKSAKVAIEAANANDPTYSIVDLSGNTVFGMKHREYCQLLGNAIKCNTHIVQVKLSKCTLDAIDAKARKYLNYMFKYTNYHIFTHLI